MSNAKKTLLWIAAVLGGLLICAGIFLGIIELDSLSRRLLGVKITSDYIRIILYLMPPSFVGAYFISVIAPEMKYIAGRYVFYATAIVCLLIFIFMIVYDHVNTHEMGDFKLILCFLSILSGAYLSWLISIKRKDRAERKNSSLQNVLDSEMN